MAEESERVKQFTYGLNSNLVIQRDRSSRLEIGPSDEVTSLSIISPDDLQAGFGSSIKRTAPVIKSKKSKKVRIANNSTKLLKGDVLEEDVNYGYKPKSIPTKRAYDVFLNIVSKMFPADSHELIKSCADLALEILKSDNAKLTERKQRLEKLFRLKKGALEENKFHELVSVGNKITDFVDSKESRGGREDDVDVPIEFEEDESVEEIIDDEKDEDESDRDEEAGEKKNLDEDQPQQSSARLDPDGDASVAVSGEQSYHGRNSAVSTGDVSSFTKTTFDVRKAREVERQEQSKMVLSTSANFDINEEEQSLVSGEKKDIDVREIEAYWLQKKVSAFFKDPLEAQEKAHLVFSALKELKEARSCENRLVELLGFEAFELIKLLMKNRLEIIYCIELAQCSGEERKKLVKKMSQDERLNSILTKLNKRTTSLQDRTKKIREDLRAQAASLKSQKAEILENASSLVGEDLSVGLSNIQELEAFKKRINIDLESIAFKNGGHTLSNKNWTLPESSKKIQKKGYMEIYIPYKKRNPNQPIVEKNIEELPKWAQTSFKNEHKKMSKLNHVQSACYEKAFNSDDNMLLCAPTGAGKTVVAQLCMLREIGKHFEESKHLNLSEFKIVYIAPMKSLVREMVLNFSACFAKYGISVKELSGDQQLSQEQISDTQIIVTTPEKWDIITRKSGERTYTQLVRLIVIDEIHLLHDSRGPVLESIVARCQRQIASTKSNIRILGLSATLPNYENVAMFLRVPEESVFFFDQGFRPCPLTQCFVGLASAKPYKQMELMNEICFEKVISQRKKQQQVLIFVHSRRETYNTGKFLKEKADESDSLTRFLDEGSSKEVIGEELEHLKDDRLKELLAEGIAIHHAGLSASDRRVVEDLFKDRHVSVLVSTATLAWGVNLPAHCVIIKGTQVYSPEKGKWTELSMLDVMQMTGRAGRPGLDSYGEAFILTTQKELKYYMSLLTEQLPIESQLVSKLPEILNAEIVLGTVRNLHEALDWLTYTYLYIRMLASPELYSVPIGDVKIDPKLYQRRVDLINSAAIVLDKNKLVNYDRKGAQFQITEFGKIAAHFYLSTETIRVFREYTKPSMTEIEILRVFSLAQEFSFVTIREEEKLELAKLLDKVPIPIKENTEEPTAKVNVLLQAYISRLKLDGFQLQADMQYIIQSAGRLMRALFSIALKSGWASVTKKCLDLCKCIEWRMWAIESPIRQFPRGIAPVVFRRVERKEFPWERWLDLKSHEISSFIDHSTQGKKVFQAIHAVPRLSIAGQVQPITRSLLRLELTLEADFVVNPEFHYTNEPFWVLIEDVDGENIVYSEYFLLNTRLKKEQVISFTIPIFEPLPPQYFIRLISDRFLGSESMMPINLRSLILPEKFAPPTELLDFTSQPVAALNDQEYSKMYEFNYFNAIQTQAFGSLYKTNENVLVCAPTSSGKTVCAELAIFRMLETKPEGKCVYMAPKKEIAELVYKDWISRFRKLGRGINVVMLTGDLQFDQKLMNTGQVVVTDAVNWNTLQRRWRRRKAIQGIHTFIMDEMHLLTSNKGHVFEECVSRMRYIASQTENQIRFIGLSTSVANARDLGEWIGCKSSNILNFSPSVRPVRLDLLISSFDNNHFDARQLSMIKPAYHQITQNSENKAVIVFVSSRKMARQVAIDFMNLAAQEEKPDRFLKVRESDIQFELDSIGNELLKSTVRRGVAFYHDQLSVKEKQAVSALIKAQAIQIVIVEHSACWSMDMSAFMVVVMGTKYFDGTTQTYSNYPLFDLLQMLGKASRSMVDSSSKAVVFCEASRKEFLKKFLYEPFPVESTLDNYMADYMNAEIVNETIENVQEAVDFMTWTFLYRRLHQNPNFYNLYGTTNLHISEYLSKISEETLDALEAAGCLKMKEDKECGYIVSPLNLGHIASYYNIQFGTIEIYVSMLDESMTLRKVLEVLVSSEEFLEIPMRLNEEESLRRMSRNAPLSIENAQLSEPRTKAHLLLQAHFSRQRLGSELAFDREEAVKLALRLIFGMVDVISSNGWLKPALSAMELCQMVTQGVWDNSSQLLQLPHIDAETATRLESENIKSPLDFSGENEDVLKSILKVSKTEFEDIVTVANNFPNPEVTFELSPPDAVLRAGKPAKLVCKLVRDEGEDMEDDEKSKEGSATESSKTFTVFCPRYPLKKVETWWLLVGDPVSNKLLGIKRVALTKREMEIPLNFVPHAKGKQQYVMYLMSDSYLGVDQEYAMELNVEEDRDH